jgi:Mn2+/Fe2+ NRAMP family transporter
LLIGIVIKVITGSAIGYELPFVIAISVIYLPTPLALGIVAIIKSKDPNAVAKSAAKVFGVIAIVLWGLNIVLVISSLFSN